MSHYALFHPDTELLGGLVLSYIQSINVENYRDLYADFGLDALEPDKWYPAQPMIDIFNRLVERGGEMFDFVSIGMAVAKTVPLPPTIAISDVMIQSPQFYLSGIRGTDPGWYRTSLVSSHHVQLDYRVPFPDDFQYGIIFGLAQKTKPAGSSFLVQYDDTQPRREQGGEFTRIHVTWTEV